MPYINPDRRPLIDKMIPILSRRIKSSGDLNYAITKLCLEIIRGERSYTKVVAVLGTLHAVSLEFYRRYAAPYEQIKMKENGDVYPEI